MEDRKLKAGTIIRKPIYQLADYHMHPTDWTIFEVKKVSPSVMNATFL